MKIVMICEYPRHQYAGKLGIEPSDIKRSFSCNQILAESVSAIPGVDLTVLTNGKGFGKTKVIEDGSLKVHYLVSPPKINMLTLFQYTKWKIHHEIRQIKPDIVHGIGTEHLWPYIAVTSSFPSVVTIHGIMSEIVRNLRVPFFSYARFFYYLERYVLKKSRNLISISPYVEKSVSQSTGAKIYSIENAAPELFFKAMPQPSNSGDILFVGDLEERKSVLDLLRAYNQIRQYCNSDYEITICGPMTNSSYSNMVQDYVANNLKNKVKFTGFLTPDALKNEYEKAAFLVLPSQQETAPGSVFEAMSVGIPVIATDIAGVPYMVKNGKSGFLFPVGDVSRLAELMKCLIDNPQLRDEMGKEGKKIAMQRWRPELVARQTVDVYERILRDHCRA